MDRTYEIRVLTYDEKTNKKVWKVIRDGFVSSKNAFIELGRLKRDFPDHIFKVKLSKRRFVND